MNGETKAWAFIIIATVISFLNDVFNFLPTKPDYPHGWDNLYFVVVGGAVIYLLVKHAVKEALDEKDIK
jgi:hypothetical protein